VYSDPTYQVILQAFEAITTKSSLEMLYIHNDKSLICPLWLHNLEDTKRALSLNTPLKDIRIVTHRSLYRAALHFAMSSSSLQDLTLLVSDHLHLTLVPGHCQRPRVQYLRGRRLDTIKDTRALVQDLAIGTTLCSFTLEGPNMDSDLGAAFAIVFHGDHTIKTLTWMSGLSFFEALPQD
jgi:hypothetical protein